MLSVGSCSFFVVRCVFPGGHSAHPHRINASKRGAYTPLGSRTKDPLLGDIDMRVVARFHYPILSVNRLDRHRRPAFRRPAPMLNKKKVFGIIHRGEQQPLAVPAG